MNEYYVYAHIKPTDKTIFYIGIGKKDRVFDGGRLRNKQWKQVVYENGGFLFEFIHRNIFKEEALKIERELIIKYGLDNLTNIVGEQGNSTAFKKGGVPWNKGLKSNLSCSYKSVIYDGNQYDCVTSLIKYLNIGKTTFYRRLKKRTLKIKYV